MLHFLAALALCIFIGERVWHYWREWRWRREQRRYVRWLQGEDIRTGLPSWVPQQKREPPLIDPPAVWVTAGLVALLIVIVTLLATHA